MSSGAKKDLAKIPKHIRAKFGDWVNAVTEVGLEEVRKNPGWNDHSLKGKRNGQRAIYLSKSYRAIYVIRNDGIEFVSVEEVNKHDY